MFWALLLPVCLAGLKLTLLHRAPLLPFLRAVSFGLAAAGVVLISFWAAWIKADKRRAYKKVLPFLRYLFRCKLVRACAPCNASARAFLARTARRVCVASPRFVHCSWFCVCFVLCPRARDPQQDECMAATYLWVGAAVLGGWCLLLAALAYYISTSPDKRGRTAMGKLLPLAVRGRITRSHLLAHARHVASSALTHTFLVHARHACICCMGAQALLSMLCSWVAAQIGPVQMRLADGLQVLCGAGMASTAAIMCAVLGWHAVTTHPLLLEALAHENGGAHLFLCISLRSSAQTDNVHASRPPFFNTASACLCADWLRAVLLSFAALPYLFFLPLRCAPAHAIARCGNACRAYAPT